jgi:hypothetical protein
LRLLGLWRGGLSSHVEDGQGVTGLHQVQRYWPAHISQSDKSNPHVAPLMPLIRAESL